MNVFEENKTVYYYGPAQGLRGEPVCITSVFKDHRSTRVGIRFFNVENPSDFEPLRMYNIDPDDLRTANEHLAIQLTEAAIHQVHSTVAAWRNKRRGKSKETLPSSADLYATPIAESNGTAKVSPQLISELFPNIKVNP